jgi:hypothetical protein
MKHKWQREQPAEQSAASPAPTTEYNEQPEVTAPMQTTYLSPRQYTVVDIQALMATLSSSAPATNPSNPSPGPTPTPAPTPAPAPAAPAVLVTALSVDTDNHDAAYAVAIDATHVAVVPRGPMGPFVVTVKGTDIYGNAAAPLVLPFDVVPNVKLTGVVGPLQNKGVETPGIPARW